LGDEARGESPTRAAGSMNVTPRSWTPPFQYARENGLLDAELRSLLQVLDDGR